MWLTEVMTHKLSTSPQLVSMIFKCASPLPFKLDIELSFTCFQKVWILTIS